MDTPKQDAIGRANLLLAQAGTAALSVQDVDSGQPFVTLVNVAVDANLRPLLLVSDLSQHTKSLKAKPQASLLLHAPIAADGDPMLTFRATVSGRFEQVEDEDALAAFEKRHPYATLYSRFGDFHLWRMVPEQVHIIAGFGRAYTVRFRDIAAL